MRLAYADPPYPGQSHLYRHHPDYGGEVDHAELAGRLWAYDGWVLHTSSPALGVVLAAVESARPAELPPARVLAWVKPFAAFKANIPVAYAWEPVLVRPARPAVVSPRSVSRDWLAEPITLGRGLAGAKPAAVCRWLFDVLGADPADTLDDLYPGTGAVAAAWDDWRGRAATLGDQLTIDGELAAVAVAAEMDCDAVAAENRDDQDQGERDGRD